ncbi:MAG: hypothetical protein ACTSVV_02135 [Promethearchaeota archaeon]
MIKIYAVRNINYLYYVIGSILFLIGLAYVIKNRKDKLLVKIFILGIFFGSFFELIAVLIGLRNLNAQDIGYNYVIIFRLFFEKIIYL